MVNAFLVCTVIPGLVTCHRWSARTECERGLALMFRPAFPERGFYDLSVTTESHKVRCQIGSDGHSAEPRCGGDYVGFVYSLWFEGIMLEGHPKSVAVKVWFKGSLLHDELLKPDYGGDCGVLEYTVLLVGSETSLKKGTQQ